MGVYTRVSSPEGVLWQPPNSESDGHKSQCRPCPGGCGKAISEGDGYPYRLVLFCEDCIWRFAENGEFYCG